MANDDLRIFLGSPCVINQHITIKQPSLREIIEYGEKEYFSLTSLITTVPSDMKSPLWDIGIDYTKIKPFELFAFLCRGLVVEKTRILFGEFDFSKLKPQNNADGDLILTSKNGAVIDWNIYRLIVDFVSKSNLIDKKPEEPGNENTKMMLIQWDREDRELLKKKPHTSQLRNIISALVNSQGFKYDYQTIQNITIYQLFDAVQRINIINNASTLLQGIYCNPIMDSSKIDKSHLNWLQGNKHS